MIFRNPAGTATPALRELLTSMKSDLGSNDDAATNFVDDDLQRQRVVSAWVAVFGTIALLLAAIGVYGVIAQSVYQRTRELAVRAAVGARPSDLLRLVLADGVRLGILGTVFGALSVVIAFPLLRATFVGMERGDLRASVFGLLALGAATLLASFIPARRAARLNPVDALRSD